MILGWRKLWQPCVAVAVLGLTQSAAAQQCQGCAAYQDWYWNAPVQSIAHSFVVVDDARTTFWASNWRHGYIGVQWLEESQLVLFSVWDATEGEAGDAGTWCQTFGGEGVGWSCRSEEFRWRPGVVYTLRTERRGEWVHGTISGEGKSLYLGRIKAAHLAHLGHFANNFIEQFGIVTCETAPQASAIFYPPQANGTTARNLRGLVNENCPRGFVTPYEKGSYVRFGSDSTRLSRNDREAITALLETGRSQLRIPYLPSAATPWNRSYVWLGNRSALAGEVLIRAIDDMGTPGEAASLKLGGDSTKTITAMELELGARTKGLVGSAGSGHGDWRLEMSSQLDIEARSFVRTPNGLVAPIHDVVEGNGIDERIRVVAFNPASNLHQVSKLRLINPGTDAAEVFIRGVDATGQSPGDGVWLRLPPGGARTISASELEQGSADGTEGSIGDGKGQWRLFVESNTAIKAMSLLESSRHLTNMSSRGTTSARSD